MGTSINGKGPQPPSPRIDNVTFQQYDGLSFANDTFIEILFDETQTVTHDASGVGAIPSWASLVTHSAGVDFTASGKQLCITKTGVYFYKINITVAPFDTDADTTGYRQLRVSAQDTGTPAFTAASLVPDPNPNDLILPVAASGWFVVPTAGELPFKVEPCLYQNSGSALTAYAASLTIQKVS